MSKDNIKKIILNKEKVMSAAPIIGLVLVMLAFAVLTEGKSISKVNLKVLTNQFIMTALVAIGMVYCFACGALDMSAGGSLCLSAICGALAGVKTGSLAVMIVVVIIVAMLIALVKGLLAAYLTLPVFIVTIILGSLLSAIGLVLLGDETTLSVRYIVKIKDLTAINLIFIIGFFLVAMIIFNYTKVGKACKLQGGNPLASGQSGIDEKKIIIMSFLMSGAGIALAAIITILKTKTVTAASGGSIGNDVLVAIVLGGMPLTGGPKSKISAGIIGAATITILNNGLSLCNVSNDMIQIVRGIIFIFVVFITSMTYRTKLLPR
ncbi:ribose transport system permease protein [Lachnotalea glycerini]|uniref:ABC transporter permease n=1 Tax=Lachnotalea glycerini TaxID=1763509 RepID=A0A255I8J1_9FIRM|nr:ABC transporter permease [Lachnotalea glycerini]PXV91186.1 ribose transport system permease protein [Lachnotalea glycerini]RDY31650.1 ABC transporter permease [Lachnotalea glycerini]